MADEVSTEEINYEEQYGVLTEECKKLKIDISSLQLSNRSLVNQNRDEKKKVMDLRLQMADLEGRLKTFDSTKQELTDCQMQCERIRMTLETNEAKLEDAERRADEASGLIKIKDSVILKQSNFTKEIEENLRSVTEDRDRLLLKSETLETDLHTALLRGEECEELREKVKKLEELFNTLVSEKCVLSLNHISNHYRSETTTESGLAAANEYFKDEQVKANAKIENLKDNQTELETTIEKLNQDKIELGEQMDKQHEDYEKLSDKCATLEARIKEMATSDRRYAGVMMGSRLIGPTLPPWISDDKKMEDDLERLSKADPATLRAKVMELESQLSELNQLLTYREDVILRIHEEIGKKASRLEAVEVEKSSLTAQVSILKRELSTARDDLGRRGIGPADLEAEVERLRGKRDREYQRRKRIEGELDEVEKENQEVKQRIKRLEEAVANAPPPPKPVAPQSDPSDRNRIVELQGTVNQLRMDNEAKRSELFDLRSRFDTKSTQMDKISAELKTKERSTGELTTQLNSVRTQLETTAQDLESVRCRAVRGGAEVDRWQSDLTSLQVTNKFLTSQLNEMRTKLLAKDHLIADLTKRCTPNTSSKPEPEPVLLNGDVRDELYNRCGDYLNSSKDVTLSEDVDDSKTKTILMEKDLNFLRDDALQLRSKLRETEKLLKEAIETKQSAEHDRLEVESKLSAAQLLATQASEDCVRERQAVEVSNTRVQLLTTQVNELETSLSSTRSQLHEAKSEQRKTEAEATPSIVSPPAKRTRRGGKSAATNHHECASCTELKKQITDLENVVTEANSRENALTNQANLRHVFRISGSILNGWTRPIWRSGAHQRIMCVQESDSLITPHRSFTVSPHLNGTILRQLYRALRSTLARKRPTLVGVDEHGNRFYEAPPDRFSEHPNKAKYTKRYVLVSEQKDLEETWMQLSGSLPTVSSEWESWLRHRRSLPPSAEEVAANAAEAQRRAMLANQLDAKHAEERTEMIREGLLHASESTTSPTARSRVNPNQKMAFPIHPDLEVAPGEGMTEEKKTS